MKKIILALVIIISGVFCFSGCDGLSGKFWEDAAKNAEVVFTNNDFKKVYNITFNSNLNTIMMQSYGSSYAEIKNVLVPLFESSVYYAYNHYNDFLIAPKDASGSFKKKIKAVNDSLINFEVEIMNFLEKKSQYETYITFTALEQATSDIEIARLLKFKRDYISVIESALKLSQDIFDARRAGYYDYSDYTSSNALIDEVSDCSLAVNASGLAITKSAVDIVRAYNAKEVASEYQNYWQEAQTFHNNVVKKFESGALTISASVKDKLNVWKGVYELFLEESEQFKNTISILDLSKLSKNNNNAKKYAEETKNEQDEYYAQYFLDFYKNVELLGGYTSAIFM